MADSQVGGGKLHPGSQDIAGIAPETAFGNSMQERATPEFVDPREPPGESLHRQDLHKAPACRDQKPAS
jgi:hypothetical protein